MDDPAYNGYYHIWELPEHRLKELKRFFQDYKKLEEIDVEVREFEGPDRARAAVAAAIDSYRDAFGSKAKKAKKKDL